MFSLATTRSSRFSVYNVMQHLHHYSISAVLQAPFGTTGNAQGAVTYLGGPGTSGYSIEVSSLGAEASFHSYLNLQSPQLPQFPQLQVPSTSSSLNFQFPQLPQFPQPPQLPQLPQFPQLPVPSSSPNFHSSLNFHFPQLPQFPQFPQLPVPMIIFVRTVPSHAVQD